MQGAEELRKLSRAIRPPKPVWVSGKANAVGQSSPRAEPSEGLKIWENNIGFRVSSPGIQNYIDFYLNVNRYIGKPPINLDFQQQILSA